MTYKIHLQNFEGPLDLLLFLIRKNEVDIYDIPIAEITRQFMEYLNIIELLDLDYASEFILMAATLIRIKARLLLPKPEPENDGEDEDPREELVQRLLEYQRFKDSAVEIGEIELEHRDYFRADNFLFVDEDKSEEHETLPEKQITLYDLMGVFIDVLKRVPPVTEHTIENIPVTIKEQSSFVLNYLSNAERVLFKDLLLSQITDKIVLIVTFIAILELVRNRKISLNQNQPFSEIWICKN